MRSLPLWLKLWSGKLWSSKRWAPLVGLGSAVAAFTMCDSTARIYLKQVQFDDLAVVGATPVKVKQTAAGPRWVPACGGDAEAMRLDFVLRSTPRTDADQDYQIRPGEDAVGSSVVKLGKNLATSHFDLSFSCLDGHDGTGASAACPKPSPSSALAAETPMTPPSLFFTNHVGGEKVVHAGDARSSGRGKSVGVAILIDASGTLTGKVDPKTCLEAKEGAIDSWDSASLKKCQSDSAGLRILAAKQILGLLNPQDPAIVFRYSEEGCKVVCNAEDVFGITGISEEDKLKNCYTTDRSLTLGTDTVQPGLDKDLTGLGSGRSSLWSCANLAWSLLATKGEAARHMVVLTDGPDTCSKDGNENFQSCFRIGEDATGAGGVAKAQDGCPNAVKFTEFKKAVTDFTESGRQDQHVSFVHFQSKGYGKADPRMQEIACMTGGHYQFLNFNAIAQETSERQTAIIEAVTNLRYTFGGFWSLVTKIPALVDNAQDPANARAGGMYALEGLLQLKSDNAIVPKGQTPISAFLKVGPDPANGLGSLDGRLVVKRACTKDADCAGAAGGCGIRCNLESGLCDAPAPGAACTGAGGTFGVCCAGSCDTAKQVCTDPQNPLACP